MPVTIQASLGLDDSKFQATLARSIGTCERAAARIGSSFGTIAGAFGVGLGVSQVVAFGRSLIEFGSNIQDQSDAIGISTDKFQQFSFAIEQCGGEQETFTKGMAALISKVEDAKNGNETARESFRKLGISLSDIENRKVDEILLLIADALQRSDGAGAAFAATADILGSKVALKMVPALKAGSAGFLELARTAKIASAEAISAADEIGDLGSKFIKDFKTEGLQKLGQDVYALKKIGSLLGLNENPDDARLRERSDRHNASVPAELGGGLVKPAPAYRITEGLQQDEHIKDFIKEQERLAKIAAEDLEYRQKRYQEIEDINREIGKVELENFRATLIPQDQLNSMLEERARLLSLAKTYEADIFQLHQKDAATLRLSIAQLSGKIKELKRSIHETGGDLGRTNFEDKAEALRQKAISGLHSGTRGGADPFSHFRDFTTLNFGAAIQGARGIQGSASLVSALQRAQLQKRGTESKTIDGAVRDIRDIVKTAFAPAP